MGIKGSEKIIDSSESIIKKSKFAQENFERVGRESENRKQYVEFRDANYAELDKRVDDWMNKVNNVKDINRFQFKPGFSSTKKL